MSLASGPIEEQVLALERQYWQLPDWRALSTRLVALEQQLAQLWTIWPSAPVVTTTPTTIHGNIHGCNAGNLSGQTVTVSLTSTGAVLFTATSSSTGLYSGTANLPPGSNGVTVAVNAPTSTRFAATSTTASVTAGVSTTVNLTLAPATGYVCYFSCIYPLPTTLQVTSSGVCGGITFPNDTLTYQIASGVLTLSFTGGIFVGTATFSDGTNSDWVYVLNNGGLWRARQSAGNTVQLAGASGSITLNCGPPFSWPLSCGTNSFGGSIHE